MRQSQLIAQGQTVIQAVNGLKIDVKQVNQQTVSQTIDTMVKADPQLAWIKDAEKRGDVDWRQVKEIHDSFKYSNSGLGPASQIIIAIVMAAVVGPMAMGAVGASTGAAVTAGTMGVNTAAFLTAGAGAVAAGAGLPDGTCGALAGAGLSSWGAPGSSKWCKVSQPTRPMAASPPSAWRNQRRSFAGSPP